MWTFLFKLISECRSRFQSDSRCELHRFVLYFCLEQDRQNGQRGLARQLSLLLVGASESWRFVGHLTFLQTPHYCSCSLFKTLELCRRTSTTNCGCNVGEIKPKFALNRNVNKIINLTTYQTVQSYLMLLFHKVD